MTPPRRLGLALAAVALAIAVILLIVWPARRSGDAGAGTVSLRWQAPAAGSAAVKYVVWIRDVESARIDSAVVDAAPGAEQRYTLAGVEPGRRYEGRVAGIDQRGRRGPWSPWSPVYGGAAAR